MATYDNQDNIRMDTQRMKTSKERPKWRWRDNIEEVGSSQWIRLAQDSSAWRELWRPAVASDDADDDLLPMATLYNVSSPFTTFTPR